MISRGVAVLLLFLLTGHLAFGDPKDKESKAQQKRIAALQEKLLKEKLRALEEDRLRKSFEAAPKEPRRRQAFFESFPLKKMDVDLRNELSKLSVPGGLDSRTQLRMLYRQHAFYAKIQYARDCRKLGKNFEALEVEKELGFK